MEKNEENKSKEEFKSKQARALGVLDHAIVGSPLRFFTVFVRCTDMDLSRNLKRN